MDKEQSSPSAAPENNAELVAARHRKLIDLYRKKRYALPFDELMRDVEERIKLGDETARAQRGVLMISGRCKSGNDREAWEELVTAAARCNDYALCYGSRNYIFGKSFEDARVWLMRGALLGNSYIGAEMGGIFNYLGIGGKVNVDTAKDFFSRAQQMCPYGYRDGIEDRIEFCDTYKDDLVLGLMGDVTRLHEIGKCWEARGMFELAYYWFSLGAIYESRASLLAVYLYIVSGTVRDDYVFELENFYWDLNALDERVAQIQASSDGEMPVEAQPEVRAQSDFAKENPIQNAVFNQFNKLWDGAAKILPIPNREEYMKEKLDEFTKKRIKNFLDEQSGEL